MEVDHVVTLNVEFDTFFLFDLGDQGVARACKLACGAPETHQGATQDVLEVILVVVFETVQEEICHLVSLLRVVLTYVRHIFEKVGAEGDVPRSIANSFLNFLEN